MSNSNDVQVWDPFVRVFHWTLVLTFATAFLTEDDLLGLHVWAGYLATALVVLRILWGFIGAPHARFSDFVRGPGETLAYLRQLASLRAPRHLGHNPAGGAMILALLLGVLATGLTGLLLWGAEGFGVLADFAQSLGVAGESGAEALEEVHELFANLTLLMVVLHLAGVLLGSLLHGENLPRAMVTGRKRA